MIEAVIGILACVLGIGIGYAVRFILSKYAADSSEKNASQLVSDAKREAATIVKEGKIEAKADIIKAREDFEKSTESRRAELAKIEERGQVREQNLDRKVAMIDKKEDVLEAKLASCETKSAELDASKGEVSKLIDEQHNKLQALASMSKEEARTQILDTVEKEMHGEIGGLIRRMQEQAR
ncbi:MAG: DUF3552 domain-containing protein, partial [Kiritimatiellae bacterium]|nr:DUF3552 domain-containing protein [Kiritimatiellia bacterium]